MLGAGLQMLGAALLLGSLVVQRSEREQQQQGKQHKRRPQPRRTGKHAPWDVDVVKGTVRELAAHGETGAYAAMAVAAGGDASGAVAQARQQPLRATMAEECDEAYAMRLAQLGECVVCMTSGCGMVFAGCGHLCVCAACGPLLSRCPVCREDGAAIRVFLAQK